MAANQRRSVSWFSLSSVHRPATATATATAPPARSDSIRPPAFKPFRLPATAQPQKPTRPPTFRTASTAKPATSPSPQPPDFRQFRPVPPPVSHPVTIPTSSAPPKPQPLQPAAAETEHKTNNLVPPNVDTKHHKLQSTSKVTKSGVLAFQDKAVAMQRKYLESNKKGTTRVVRLVGDNVGAVMSLNSSRNKYDYGAKPKTLQSETSSSKLFMNSNVQGVNNSIAFDSCLTHHDPGLHVSTYDA